MIKNYYDKNDNENDNKNNINQSPYYKLNATKLLFNADFTDAKNYLIDKKFYVLSNKNSELKPPNQLDSFKYFKENN